MNEGFFVLIILACVHIFANQAHLQGLWHGRFLSFASGLSFSYVFVDLLPTLEKGQPILKQAFSTVVPYFDKHAYVIALAGVLFYYGLHTNASSRRNFWLGMIGYLLFNFFIGASLSEVDNPEIKPLFLFTIAMGMHYFVADHNASEDNQLLYRSKARWLLVLFLFIGYFLGDFFKLSPAITAILVSFLAGGMILNALRYELPKREQVGYLFFVLGAVVYSFIILRIGA